MPLDGLRAWIGEVERKLGMRTRVFLVLSVIAIGGAGAAIYLAIDTRDSSVSDSDVQALQQQLEAQVGAGGTSAAGAEVAQLQAEIDALRTEVETLKGKGGASNQGGAKGGGEAGGTGAGAGSDSGGGSNSSGDPGSDLGGGGIDDVDPDKLKELLESVKKQDEELE